MSYADNFYTRTDVLTGAPQAEPGLDYYIAKATNPNAYRIIEEFKKNTNFLDKIARLRIVRNKACGHIDLSQTVLQIQQMIDTVDTEELEILFTQLKNAFRAICYEELVFRTFALSPMDRMHGVIKLVGIETKPFSDDPKPEYVAERFSYDDENEYENNFLKWKIGEKEESRSYFFSCFMQAPVLEQIQVEFDHGHGGKSYGYHDFRTVHKFFEEKLENTTISSVDKTEIVNLFIACRNGSETLAYVLFKTYPKDYELQKHFIRGIGYLQRWRSDDFINIVKEMYTKGDFYGRYHALMSLFRVDLAARFRSTGKHDGERSGYFEFIKVTLLSNLNGWEKSAFSCAMASIYYYENHSKAASIQALYLDFFKKCYSVALRSMVNGAEIKRSEKELRKFDDLFSNFRFATLLSIKGDFFSLHDQIQLAKHFWILLYEGLVLFARDDDQEIHNYAVTCFKLGDMDKAIHAAKYLVDKHPESPQPYHLILSIYLEDRKYQQEFRRTKKIFLSSFRFSQEELGGYNSWDYPDISPKPL